VGSNPTPSATDPETYRFSGITGPAVGPFVPPFRRGPLDYTKAPSRPFVL
jgi:hypothetical protein